MSSSQLPDPWLGRSIGEHQRYRLDKRLGRGGMADVFLAMDTLLEQPVALKLLHEKLATGEMRGRFEREVALCAALRSDHIVRVSDHGVTPEGYPFFVMEYLQGQTLRQLLDRKNQLSIQRAANTIAQVCQGLQLAHQGVNFRQPGAVSSEQVKIVHRDLKPDNIFLVPTALGELVKILDFGIAKIRSDQIERANATCAFLGTYRYAAPEQFEVGKDLDERADIYSLGMILYEMLSGTDPFGFGDLLPQVSGGIWAVAHLSKPIMSLRMQPTCRQLPPDLDAIVVRCLQKDPDQRFASVEALRTALLAAAGIETGTPAGTPALATPALESTDFPTVTIQLSSPTFPTATAPSTALFDTISAPAQAKPAQIPHRLPTLLQTGIGCSVVLALGLAIYVLSRAGILSSPLQSANPTALQNQADAPSQPQLPTATSIKSLSGHTDTVWTIAAAPDAQTLVSGSFDRTVRVWNRRTGALLHVLSGHTDAVRSVAVSRDGQFIVSASSDKTIKIWQLHTGKLLHTLIGHMGPVWSVAISPDGQTLVSGSYDGTVKLWNLKTGKLLQTLPDHYDSVWSVAISPDGQTLVSGSYDGTIKLWNLQSGKLLRTVSGHTEAVRSVAISPNGQRFVSGSWDKTIKVWKLATGELLHTLAGHSDRVVSVAISPSGQTVASGSLDRTIKHWNIQTGQPLQTLSGHRDWVISLAFSDETTIVSGSRDRTIKIWQLF